jgi:hypothetical protein
MRFDNPYRTSFGEVEPLWATRGCLASRGDWVQGRFQDGDRHCLVAALSIAKLRHAEPTGATDRTAARYGASSNQLLGKNERLYRLATLDAVQ